MKNIYCLTTILIFLIFVLPTIILSIGSFIVAFHNFNTDCDGEFIKLSTWLITNGVFNISSIIILSLLSYLFFKKEKFCYIVILFIFYVFIWIFTLVWNILGSIELFEYAEECRLTARSLWIMVLVSLIAQWVGLFATCCIKRVASTNPKYVPPTKHERDNLLSINHDDI